MSDKEHEYKARDTDKQADSQVDTAITKECQVCVCVDGCGGCRAAADAASE